MSNPGRGHGAGRGFRPGRGQGYNNSIVRGGWKSNHPDLKEFVFEEGTAEKAGQFTRSMKEIIEWIRKSDRREAENIATELETEAEIVIAAPPPPEGEEDLANPGQRLPPDAVEVAIHQQEIQLIAKLPCKRVDHGPTPY
jgi:hypothetical protein